MTPIDNEEWIIKFPAHVDGPTRIPYAGFHKDYELWEDGTVIF